MRSSYRVPVEKVIEVLNKLKIPYTDKGEFLVCKTCCHNKDAQNASYKLYYYKNSGLFHCYTECGTMSPYQFLEHYYNTNEIPFDWHKDIHSVLCGNLKPQGITSLLNQPMDDFSKYKQTQFKKALPTYPTQILQSFSKAYPPEWLSDGITRAAMDKYNILYSIPQNKIIIPHYDINNNLIGIRGRALDPWEVENVGKYMPIQLENKWYSHPLSLNLYGLNISKEAIKQHRICYVGEGEKFCLQCASFSMPNVSVAVCGSVFNKTQLDLLLRYCQPKEIVICFDNEEKPNEKKYFEKLCNLCQKYKMYSNFSFVYDTQLLSLKESPSDKGEQIFRRLIERRIKI